MRPDIPGNKINVVSLNQFIGNLFSCFRLKPIVPEYHFYIESSHLAANILNCEVDSILHILADNSRPGGKRRHEPDFDLVRGADR